MLSVQKLSQTLSGKTVLAELSFAMAPGEVLALLGPSGSGKTSLQRLIAGFDAPSAGEVHLQGATGIRPGPRLAAAAQAPGGGGLSGRFHD